MKSLAVVFWLVLASKFLWIVLFANPTPYWDQWDAEADQLYKPWVQDRLSLGDLVKPHNEHRILVTRLFNIGLFQMNGREWDPILQMEVNAILHAATICLLLWCLLPITGRERRWPLLVFGAIVSVIPFGWENTLAGFQSQFYFLLLFSVVSLRCVTTSPPLSGQWWGGLGCAILAWLSMASGALTLFAVAAATAATMFATKDSPWHRGAAGAGVALLVGLWCVWMTPHVPAHTALKASSGGQFFGALRAILAWPTRGTFLAVLVVQLPLGVFMIQAVRAMLARKPMDGFLFAMGLWFYAQCAALAYGRAGLPLEPRYTDVFSVGLILNMAAMGMVFHDHEHWPAWCRRGIMAVWLGCVAWGVWGSAGHLLQGLTYKQHFGRIQEERVRGYIATHDLRYLQPENMLEIPYPSTERLKTLLDDPVILGFLPQGLVDGAVESPPASRLGEASGIDEPVPGGTHGDEERAVTDPAHSPAAGSD